MTPANHIMLDGHLTDRDIHILEDLERFRLLTTRQLQRLHFPAQPLGPHTTAASATRGTTRVLGRLETLGAISRLKRRIGGIKHGSALTIWQLGPAGDRFLRTRRGDTVRRRFDEPGLPFAEHHLAVADVAVSLIEQASAGRFELVELDAEPACWRTFTGAGAGVVTLKPDLLVVTADDTTETHSFVEVDRGTEHLPALLRKCRTYQRYRHTGSEQESRGVFPAVVWIVPDWRRAKTLAQTVHDNADLDAELFWIITPDGILPQLAPYVASLTT